MEAGAGGVRGPMFNVWEVGPGPGDPKSDVRGVGTESQNLFTWEFRLVPLGSLIPQTYSNLFIWEFPRKFSCSLVDTSCILKIWNKVVVQFSKVTLVTSVDVCFYV